MKAPINYPCVMFEKQHTIGVSISENNLLQKFAFIQNEKEFYNKAKYFDTPVICHYYSVVRKAKEIFNSLK